MLSLNKEPLCIGLTGSMGAGKSMVAAIFAVLGIPVYNADSEAKKIYDCPEFREKLHTVFGEKVFNSQGIPDKKKIASLVFSDKQALQVLNSIIHPFVIDQFTQWTKQQKSLYVIHESALIYEAGWTSLFYKIVVVHAESDVIFKRVQQRDGLTVDEIRARLNNQWTASEKLTLADFVIQNNGDTLLIPQVLFIHEQIQKMAENENKGTQIP